MYRVLPNINIMCRNGTKGTEKVVQKDNSVIVVTARLDALSLFDQTEVGFDSPTTGMVALMSAARLLKQVNKKYY